MSTVLVVGGSSGIGLELIKNLINDETIDEIINVDIKRAEFNYQDSELIDKRSRKDEFNFYQYLVDLSVDDDIRSFIDNHTQVFFDKVFFCAGIAEYPTTTLKNDFTTINKLISINSGSFIKILGGITIRDGGSIVVVSSSHAVRAASVNPIYSATKGFINSFVRSYSKTLIDQSKSLGTSLTRINAVCPEMVATPLIYDIFEGQEDKLNSVVKSRIMGRMLTSQEVVDSMLFLASDKASAITGESLSIGGKI